MSVQKRNGSPREPTEPQARDKPTPAAVDVLSHAGASGYNHWTCVRRRLDLRVPEAKLGYVDRRKRINGLISCQQHVKLQRGQ
jgi:hypothetical protein